MTDNAQTCEFCDKRGLPVLPVRFAVADGDSLAPFLAAPMQVEDGAGGTVALSGHAHYTARLLRGGYFYVYDEARNRWEGYYVTSGGYFLRFDVSRPMPAALAKGREPCLTTGHREIAGCVTIRDPKRATKVWFGFSDVEWTPAVLQKNADASYRAKHMQMLDVQAWMARKQHPQARPIKDVGKAVAEYKLPALPGARSFGWSPFPFRGRKDQLDQLLHVADKLAPGEGLILAVPDPAGTAQELASLMAWRTHEFLSDPQRARRLADLNAIAALEQGVKHQAELQTCADVESYADMVEKGPAWYNPNPALSYTLDSDPVKAEKIRGWLTAKSLDEAAERTWRKYTQYFDDNARKQWAVQYQDDARNFGETRIEPLALAHVALMQSARMTHYFECCYDPRHWPSSLVYVQVVTACVENTQDKQVCQQLYTGWLEKARAADAQNILGKALKYNNPDIENAIQGVAAQSLDMRSIPWDNIFGVYKTAEEALGEGGADEMARLMVQIAGPAAKVLSEALDGTAGSAFVAMMGGIARVRLEKVEFRGKRSAFRRVLVRELLKGTGEVVTPKQLNRAVLAEMNRLRIRSGKQPDGTLEQKWLVYIDPSARNLGASSGEIARAIRSADQLDNLAQANWRNIINGNVRLGVVSGLLQFVSLGKLLEDDANAMGNEKTEAAWRLGAGYAALGGTFAEVSGTMMEKLPSALSDAGRAWKTRMARLLTRGGRAAGVAAGLIMAVWDGVRAKNEYLRGNTGVALLYGGSALLGLLVSYGFIAVWGTALMFWLVAALVLVGLLIELNKPNKLMEWLQRCVWGKGPGNWGSLEEDQRQFERALKG